MKAATGACAIAMLAFIGTARLAGAADIHVYSPALRPWRPRLSPRILRKTPAIV